MVKEGADNTSPVHEFPVKLRAKAPETASRKSAFGAYGVIRALCQGLNILGVIVLVFMTFLTVADVIGRYAFQSPILGSTELTEYFLIVIVFLCVGWCTIQGKMVVVDLVLNRLPLKVQAGFNCLTLLISLAVLAITAWQTSLETMAVRDSLKGSSILRIPAYPFMWIVVIGFSVMCLVIIVQIAQNFYKVVHDEP
jgi:TRAP-type C4-dicarboxylate transport system permease small subunit